MAAVVVGAAGALAEGAPSDEGVEGLAVEEADDGVAEPRRQRGEHDFAGQVEERVAARHGPDGEIHGMLIQNPEVAYPVRI